MKLSLQFRHYLAFVLLLLLGLAVRVNAASGLVEQPSPAVITPAPDHSLSSR